MPGAPIRLRKYLSPADAPPTWPDGIRLVPVSTVDPAALHSLLTAAYANGSGSIPPQAEWWLAVTADEEYDPDLVFIAADKAGTPIGIALCWNSSFIKDVAVDAGWRGRSIGEALLRTSFAAFRQRGFAHVDLKVVADNEPAIRLYRRLGMVEAPL